MDRVAGATTPLEQASAQSRPRLSRAARTGVGLFLGMLALVCLVLELRTSRLEAVVFSRAARGLRYTVGRGSSPAISFPESGPHDTRLGYTQLSRRLLRLEERGFAITSQARFSPLLQKLAGWGLYPIYPEKTRAGLRIVDRHQRLLSSALYPERVWDVFSSVPPLVADTLLFVENRELLEPGSRHRNPAVEWDRLGRAIIARVFPLGDSNHRSPGGSTLATQLEKFRHSPGGRTSSIGDKLRQMFSATLRAYRSGPDTRAARRQIVLDYLNTVPLAAVPGIGEVRGIGDGLWAWYGSDVGRASVLLAGDGERRTRVERARAYKQVLSLFMAQRRPSYYLSKDREALRNLTDHFLHGLFDAGIINADLRDAALAADLEFRQDTMPPSPTSFAQTKATDAVRAELLPLMGVPRLYDLDRLDLTVLTTLDRDAQVNVARVLRGLRDPARAQAVGLREPGLLARGNPENVIYSFMLLERRSDVNLLRVQADTFDQPFKVNEGMKLDLGSTAKLRTLTHYLQIVGHLHDRYARRTPESLHEVPVSPLDRITRWAVGYLAAHPQAPLHQMLEAALERRYSASSRPFFTGGGLHRFANYNPRDDGRVISIREAFRRSVNLPFIRLMRDIVSHTLYGNNGLAGHFPSDVTDHRRREYLARFADWEGRVFLDRFLARHRHSGAQERRDRLVRQIHATPRRLAVLFRSLAPSVGIAEFVTFLDEHLPRHGLTPGALERLYEASAPSAFHLADRAHVAGVHPLELWLVGYLRMHANASRVEVFAASVKERQEAYRWLFRSRNKKAQDRRIRTMLEREAFVEIHRAWQRLGYPFSTLVPSLATAIGVSGDRPTSLAELLGILLSDGMRRPTVRVRELQFAKDTPYETVVRRLPAEGEQVLRPEVAVVVRDTLIEVVEQGTARRARGAFRTPQGIPIPLGGKTGTGDNRHKAFDSRGRLIGSRVLNRTAAFAFVIGDRHYGVITAYVDGEDAAEYVFTSSLPVQVLKVLAPALASVINASDSSDDERVGPAAPPRPVS